MLKTEAVRTRKQGNSGSIVSVALVLGSWPGAQHQDFKQGQPEQWPQTPH
jgi:hypothetical protein